MHSSNITLLFIIPALSILIGIVYILRGMSGINLNHLFRRGFGFFIFGFLSSFFCNQLVKSNNIVSSYSFSNELDLVFTISSAALALVSGAGFLYLYYTNFLPQLFIRSVLFFGVLSLIAVGVNTYKSAYQPSIMTKNPKHKFQEVDNLKNSNSEMSVPHF